MFCTVRGRAATTTSSSDEHGPTAVFADSPATSRRAVLRQLAKAKMESQEEFGKNGPAKGNHKGKCCC